MFLVDFFHFPFYYWRNLFSLQTARSGHGFHVCLEFLPRHRAAYRTFRKKTRRRFLGVLLTDYKLQITNYYVPFKPF